MAAAELFKKTRQPAQEEETNDEQLSAVDDVLNQADESISNEPISIEAEKKEAPAVQAPKEQSSTRDAETIGRMVAGATPTLFGFLFGPSGAARGIQQSEKFYAAGKPSKLVPVVGPEGKPVYETPEGALGQEAYQKPIRGAAGMVPKPASFYNPESGKNEQGYWDPASKQYFNSSGPVKNAQPYAPLELKEGETPGGGKIGIPFSPSTGTFGSEQKITSGEAELKGMGKEQYKTSLDITKQFPKEIAPLQQKVAEANPIIKSLQSSNKYEQIQGLQLAQEYVSKTASDKSINVAIPPSVLDRIGAIATRAATGNVSTDELNSALSLVQQVALAQQDAINAMGKASVRAGAQPGTVYKAPEFTPKPAPVAASEHKDAKQAIQWANAHPNDPRSQEIYKRFGRK